MDDDINTDLVNVERTATLIGMVAIISPDSPIVGSITWQRRIGWSLTVTSRSDWNEMWILAGRSVGDNVPCWGDTLNMLQTSRGQSDVGSNMNLHTEGTLHAMIEYFREYYHNLMPQQFILRLHNNTRKQLHGVLLLAELLYLNSIICS